MEDSKQIKRKYKKHKTSNKFSIKHFLNTKIAPVIIDEKESYPLYVRVVLNRKNNTFRSIVWGYYNDESILKNESVKSIIKIEQHFLRLTYDELSNYIRPIYNLPEYTALFRATIGELNDIVFKIAVNGMEEAFISTINSQFYFVKNKEKISKKGLEFMEALMSEIWDSFNTNPEFTINMNKTLEQILTQIIDLVSSNTSSFIEAYQMVTDKYKSLAPSQFKK